MSSSEPSQWQIALSVMENVREVQRRAESDSLRYIGLLAAFLAIRGSVTSSLSIFGLQIDDTQPIQFAIVPTAAFVAIRYGKAQVLTAALAEFLRLQFADQLPGVPRLVCPPDWDIVRDIHRRVGRIGRLLPAGAALTMHALVVAGCVINLLDSTSQNRGWALCSISATAVIIASGLLAMSEWRTSVIGRDR